MPIHEDIQDLGEHAIYKTLAPLVSIALVGAVGWLVTSIMELENTALRNEQAIIHMQNDSEDVWEDIEKLQGDVTNLRIYTGNGMRNPHR
tara:strand:- start:105 stop:374 length:270 start_codon:yes stop_codon:yes gene_type:complete